MLLYFQYNREGLVKSYSETPMKDTGTLNEIGIEVTDEEMSLIKMNYLLNIKGKELVIEKPQSVIEEEAKADLINRVENATNIDDLKTIILQLLQ